MNIIAGLDVGSTKVAEVIARVDRTGGIQILGVGTMPCQGLKRGLVVDVDSVAGAIKAANKRACRAAGVNVRGAFVGVPCANMVSVPSRGVAAISSPDGMIARADVKRALDAARVLAVPPDREVVSVLPREYIVDGAGGIRNPEGMTGVRLEVDARVMLAQAAALESVVAGVEKAGLSVRGWVIDPVASAQAVLSPEEIERGVLLVDVGGQITQIASFCEGGPIHLAWVPAGGVHVTNDIAVGKRIPIEEAETVKTRGKFDDELLHTIVDARLREILELVDGETKHVRKRGLVPCGLVFVGGGSLTPGFLGLASEILDLPARAGSLPETGLVRGRDDLAGLALTALGIVEYVARDSAYGLAGGTGSSAIGEAVSAIRGWFVDFVRDFF